MTRSENRIYLFVSSKKHLSPSTTDLRVKGCEKILQTNGTKKQAGTAILISDKIESELKAIRRDRRGHCNPLEKNLPRYYYNLKHTCSKHRDTQFHKRNTFRSTNQIDCNTVAVGDFNTPLSPVHRSSR